MSPQRFVVNGDGRDLSQVLPYEKLNELSSGIKRTLALQIIKEIRSEFAGLLAHAQKLAEQTLPSFKESAREQLSADMDAEIHRMTSLQQKNPLIREEEIEFVRKQKEEGLSYIDKTGLELQAMRIIINT
jgi:ATP-dependent helicase HepA